MVAHHGRRAELQRVRPVFFLGDQVIALPQTVCIGTAILGSQFQRIIAEGGIPLKPGALEILSWLRSNGITVAMATANDYKRTMGYLGQIGLEDSFDKVICADMVKFGKPAPDIYAYACKELDVEPSCAFAVEDSPNGVTSAYKAGCKVIMVPDLTEPDEDLKKMLYARCDTLMGIRDLIAN